MTFAEIFMYVMGALIVLDLFLVLILKVKSISMATWIAAQNHPTLIMAGTLGTVGLCYLLQDNVIEACFMAAMGAHLFSGIPVTVEQAVKMSLVAPDAAGPFSDTTIHTDTGEQVYKDGKLVSDTTHPAPIPGTSPLPGRDDGQFVPQNDPVSGLDQQAANRKANGPQS
jgi:hypothetical protein